LKGGERLNDQKKKGGGLLEKCSSIPERKNAEPRGEDLWLAALQGNDN